MKQQPTPYDDLNLVLQEVVNGARTILVDDFVGAYLHGSFAIGDFDRFSDADFLVIVEKDINERQMSALEALHRDIFDTDSFWGKHLEGTYIPKNALRDLPPPKRKFVYLDHGHRQLVRSDHDDSLIVYWTLREKGVTLAGPQPRALVSPVSADALRAEVSETMRNWREELMADPNALNNRFYQTFAVLSYCRMLQTLETGTVESKRSGAAWAKRNMDSRWHGLIQRAIDDRSDDAAVRVRQKADSQDLRTTWDFMACAVGLIKS
jgi:hypothetical protein